MSSPVATLFVLGMSGLLQGGVLLVGAAAAASSMNNSKRKRNQNISRERQRIRREREAAERREYEREQTALRREQEREVRRQEAELRREEKRREREEKRRREIEEKRRIAEEQARQRREQMELRWQQEQRDRVRFEQEKAEHLRKNALEELQLRHALLLQYQSMYDELAGSGPDGSDLSAEIEQYRNHIGRFLQQNSYSRSADLAALEIVSEKYRTELDSVKIRADALERKAEEQNRRFLAEISQALASAAASKAQIPETEAGTETDDRFEVHLAEAAAELEACAQVPDLPDPYPERVVNAKIQLERCTDDDRLRTFRALTLNPLKEKIDAIAEQREEKFAEYSDLKDEFEALCSLHGAVPEEIGFTAEAIPYLKEKIRKIHEEMDREDEQAYIKTCLDEVMSDMGYDVLGRRNMAAKNGETYSNELFSFSDGTAVLVTKSSDGMVSMEIGGIDTVDRLPNDNERAVLAREAEAFCEKNKEIEARLAEKGVVIGKRISLLPPDGAYAQIINISDFEMDTDPARLDVRRKQQNPARKSMTAGD